MTRNAQHSSSPLATVAVLVRLGETIHAIPLEYVDEVLPALPIETIPHAPAYLRGAVLIRGAIVPVVNVAMRLGLKEHVRPPEPPIVCLFLGGRRIGVEVDEALDLVDWSRGVYVDAGDLRIQDELVAGMVELDGHAIRLLNPERLLATEDAGSLRLEGSVAVTGACSAASG